MNNTADTPNIVDQWHSPSASLFCGDSAEVLPAIPTASIDFSVFSPPFKDLFTYSPSPRDLGNCKSSREFFRQFRFISREILRVMKPGRIVAVHVQQIATQKARDGEIGLSDFRGDVIRHFRRVGFIYHGEVTVHKDPQVQAIRLRGRAKGLRFAQKDKDRSWSRPALADYIIAFRTPGENAVPIVGDVSNEDWIEWASPVWFDCGDGETLNAATARSDRDERHLCPLQLPTIERCIRLWSNPGDVVLSPFCGIGSEGVVSVKAGRRFVGVELNPNYWRVSVKNVQDAEKGDPQTSIFDFLETKPAAVCATKGEMVAA